MNGPVLVTGAGTGIGLAGAQALVLYGFAILAVFLWVLRWGLQVARASNDRFSMLLAAGMTFTIFFYMAINMMMVMGLAPDRKSVV